MTTVSKRSWSVRARREMTLRVGRVLGTRLSGGSKKQDPPYISVISRCAAVVGVTCTAIALGAQARDPRVGLKAGFRDAGQAARNMELVSTLPKPEGFFDPKEPAGKPTPPEVPPAPENPAPDDKAGQAAAAAANAVGQATATAIGFANSDIAFDGNHAFVGNYHGFNSYDIENARNPRLLASVVCPGGQGDMSVYGHLLFMSVEQTRGRVDCGTQGVQEPASAERFRGVRIFDITDLRRPRQIAAVQTCRGSHTHTLVTAPGDGANLYIYGSGTNTPRPGEELGGCSNLGPKEDPNTSLYSIDVIQVPLSAPETARIVNKPRIFADDESGNIAGLWAGGNHGPGTQTTSATNRCHDITVFPELGLAAGACAGNGILLDISDPVHPVRLDAVADQNFAFWHSATFNNDGTKVLFTDEWGGGTRPRCRASDQPNWGADSIFDIVDRKLRFAGYFKMPAAQTEQENCVAHNGSIIPVPGRDIMAQAWYQGGISVFDFTDSAHPVEIAFFDRGPIDAKQLITGGYWSTYWYNGNIYGTEIARGLDVFRLTPSEFLSQNEIAAATLVHSTSFNPQMQKKIAWPANAVVARAYLDQLGRSKAIPPARAAAVKNALERAEAVRSARDRNAATTLGQLETLAAELERDASSASGVDAARLRSLATTTRSIAGRLR